LTATNRGGAVRSWLVDVLLAYGCGILIGAPAGLAVAWLTRYELAVTIAILTAMIGILCVLRIRRRRDHA
jgi:ribose/xylose/arabinose/galactoside ABC-type transport system permease subunit